MTSSKRAALSSLALGASWLFAFGAIFIVASQTKNMLSFVSFLVPTLIFALAAVIVSQNSSRNFFMGTIASLVILVVVLVSPFVRALSPVSNAASAVVTPISLLIIGKTPFEWGHPLKTPEEWIARLKSPAHGTTLNFRTFPIDAPWTRVCIFQGHSTDAQFSSVVLMPLAWKLSDKSKSTTHKNYSAIVFIDDSKKDIPLVYDIAVETAQFEPALFQQCLSARKSRLVRTLEATANTGATFGR